MLSRSDVVLIRCARHVAVSLERLVRVRVGVSVRVRVRVRVGVRVRVRVRVRVWLGR